MCVSECVGVCVAEREAGRETTEGACLSPQPPPACPAADSVCPVTRTHLSSPLLLLLLLFLLSGAVRRPELTLPGTESDEAPAGSPGSARRHMDVTVVETSLLVPRGPDGV